MNKDWFLGYSYDNKKWKIAGEMIMNPNFSLLCAWSGFGSKNDVDFLLRDR